MNEQEFREHVRSLGYGDAQIIEFEPNMDGDFHTHDFSAIGMVTRGTTTIAFETESISSGAGEFCEVKAGVLHDEKTRPEGATILLATK